MSSLKIDLFFCFSNVQTELIFLTAEAACWAGANDVETEGKAAYLLKMTFAYYFFTILLVINFMVRKKMNLLLGSFIRFVHL
jgi:hypothetical protein